MKSKSSVEGRSLDCSLEVMHVLDFEAHKNQCHLGRLQSPATRRVNLDPDDDPGQEPQEQNLSDLVDLEDHQKSGQSPVGVAKSDHQWL